MTCVMKVGISACDQMIEDPENPLGGLWCSRDHCAARQPLALGDLAATVGEGEPGGLTWWPCFSTSVDLEFVLGKSLQYRHNNGRFVLSVQENRKSESTIQIWKAYHPNAFRNISDVPHRARMLMNFDDESCFAEGPFATAQDAAYHFRRIGERFREVVVFRDSVYDGLAVGATFKQAKMPSWLRYFPANKSSMSRDDCLWTLEEGWKWFLNHFDDPDSYDGDIEEDDDDDEMTSQTSEFGDAVDLGGDESDPQEPGEWDDSIPLMPAPLFPQSQGLLMPAASN